MSRHKFLILGSDEGWHADQLRRAAASLDCDVRFALYESLGANVVAETNARLTCEAGSLADFDAVLTRTMPPGSLEQITFRLAVLHTLHAQGKPIVNPPSSLEVAIDKFATLARIAELGYSVPETLIVQSRSEAMAAFTQLGGDCVVKPIFGGEGRGVMRIQDKQLAWTTFTTLEQLNAILYVQRFIPPGGSDLRLLVIGNETIAFRRQNSNDFRTNVSSGATCEKVDANHMQESIAQYIAACLGLKFASVDMIDTNEGAPKLLEVNAVPGWKGAQSVTSDSIAERIIRLLIDQADALPLTPSPSPPNHVQAPPARDSGERGS